MILKPEVCNANPMLKMTWWVPLTQIVPPALSTRRTSSSHRLLNAWSLSKEPSERSQLPLSTDSSRPFFTVTPPLESRYGGSAKTASTLPAGIRRIRSTQSAR